MILTSQQEFSRELSQISMAYLKDLCNINDFHLLMCDHWNLLDTVVN